VNELYEKTIEVDGKTYWYDPDHDCYHRRNAPLSTFDKYAWIVFSIVLSAVVIFLDWYKG
jgi:hypothetical protein